MGRRKYVKDQRKQWKVGYNKNGRGGVNAETQEEELEEEMCNRQEKEDAPKKGGRISQTKYVRGSPSVSPLKVALVSSRQ